MFEVKRVRGDRPHFLDGMGFYSLYSAVENMCRPRALQMKSPAGELPYEKGGMLVVSIRGVNLGFWSHLGCSVQNAIIFSRKGPF